MSNPVDQESKEWRIRVRLLRRELDRLDITGEEQADYRQQLDTLIDVPPELRHVDRVRDLTEDQLLRMARSRALPEQDQEPLPVIMERAASQDPPTDSVYVEIQFRDVPKARGIAAQRGNVTMHASGPDRRGSALAYPEESLFDAKVRATLLAQSKGLPCVYLVKVTARAG